MTILKIEYDIIKKSKKLNFSGIVFYSKRRIHILTYFYITGK